MSTINSSSFLETCFYIMYITIHSSRRKLIKKILFFNLFFSFLCFSYDKVVEGISLVLPELLCLKFSQLFTTQSHWAATTRHKLVSFVAVLTSNFSFQFKQEKKMAHPFFVMVCIWSNRRQTTVFCLSSHSLN
jgi:hypothetical protein